MCLLKITRFQCYICQEFTISTNPCELEDSQEVPCDWVLRNGSGFAGCGEQKTEIQLKQHRCNGCTAAIALEALKVDVDQEGGLNKKKRDREDRGDAGEGDSRRRRARSSKN